MKLYDNLKTMKAAGEAANKNLGSILVSLERFGAGLGMDQPQRFAQFGAQIAHESGGFKHDAELWGKDGGTAAQKRYDTRTDLGNSPEADGDGYLYRGRTTIQITGKSNYKQFYDWCRQKGFNPPDFVKNPDLVNTDPWEGLGPLWYWDTRKLNDYADTGNIEMITKRINGGLNGYPDRLNRYRKLALAILGHADTKTDLVQFQQAAKNSGWYDGEIDGDDGPKTRAALQQALVYMGTTPIVETKAAPVTETVVTQVETPVPVAPKGAEKVNLNRFAAFLSTAGTAIIGFVPTDPYIRLGIIAATIIGVIILIRHSEMIANRVKGAIRDFGLGDTNA